MVYVAKKKRTENALKKSNIAQIMGIIFALVLLRWRLLAKES
jgi:hypothetical protein